MAEVVRPRAEMYSVEFHQWLTRGVCASRILPTICVHMCSVARVSCQSCRTRAGQELFVMICKHRIVGRDLQTCREDLPFRPRGYEASFSWERGRLVRTEREARKTDHLVCRRLS